MTITTKEGMNEIILSVEDRLDSITSPELQDKLISAFNEYAHVLLNFENLSYISSAGLRVLLLAQKTALGKKVSFTILNVSEEIMEVFNMTGFSYNLSINPAK